MFLGAESSVFIQTLLREKTLLSIKKLRYKNGV